MIFFIGGFEAQTSKGVLGAQREGSWALFLMVSLSIVLMGACGNCEPNPESGSSQAVASKEIHKNPGGTLPYFSYAPVVEIVAPAVVNIYAETLVRDRMLPPLFSDPFVREFFGLDEGVVLDVPRVQQSLGSGVIVRADGLIITNYHVIKGAQEIKIVLDDKREFKAEVIKKDKRTDLAALKIIVPESKPVTFPFLKLVDSDELRRGDIVLAIGNPFGLNHTVTSGIVSGLARTQLGAGDTSSYIQTDAPVNPGSSGGALVNLQGRLVGIVTAILSRNQQTGSIGLNFATPSNLVAPIIASSDDRSSLKVLRPWIGLEVQQITPEIAESLGFDRPKGVLIRTIYPQSSGGKAGLKVGDVILEINGREVVGVSTFRFRIAIQKLGSKVPFKIYRQGEEKEIMVLLEAPDAKDEEPVLLNSHHRLEGAVVAKLSPARAYELNVPYTGNGVIILAIRSHSPAYRSRLFRAGDIILEINGNPIENVQALDTLLARRSTRTIKLKRHDKVIEILFR